MNVNSIRQKVDRAIKKAPLEITVYRNNLVDDGAGGFYPDPETPVIKVATVIGILDNSGSSSTTVNSLEGGTVYTSKAPKFITIWQEGLTFKAKDFFKLDGVRYEIINPTDILNLHIYWQLELKAYM